MRILAIESATDLCSAGVINNGEIVVARDLLPRSHYRLLNAQIQSVMNQSGLGFDQLDAIGVDVGPGSFTGIRVGLASALGLSLSHDIPMIPFMSLQSLALAGMDRYQQSRAMALLDARMQECYCAEYLWSFGDLLRMQQPQLIGYEAVSVNALPLAVGPGLKCVNNAGALITDAELWPELETCLPWLAEKVRRGFAIAPGCAEAIYLRDKVAQTRAERGLS